MTYPSYEIQSTLQQAFSKYDISVELRLDCIVVENSQYFTKEKIQEIIRSVGLYPIVSEKKMNRNFVFTVSPCKTPDFSKQKCSNDIPKLLLPPIIYSQKLKIEKQQKNFYFSKDELLKLLEQHLFVPPTDVKAKDRWSGLNRARYSVSTAIDQGMCEVVSRYVKGKNPIVEIGSGIGYTFPPSLSSKTIRTQPSKKECHLLSKKISEPVYKVDIEGVYDSLLEGGKKIRLFYALNVFDTLSPSLRASSILQLSQLQQPGDHILIMLDTNPFLDDSLIESLEATYPGHTFLPFFPLTTESSKLSLVAVPLQFMSKKASASNICDMIKKQTKEMSKGISPEMQITLHKLQKAEGLKVIELESFFVEQVKKQLAQTGYKVDVYYHNSFTAGDVPKGVERTEFDLFYKPVTDTATVRQWSLDDEDLLNSLSSKGLSIPQLFNQEFLFSLREKEQKIFGAEILVIAGKKM